ncbi:hypothetical protein KOR42_44920 [Thalassoglobus neptunius]|uniref:Glycosyltransferase RgtA/B/C/D-like domain-containing protein n=1 Tax=Thalassoglobus neptunius TaxID=1938619 RepID=A0A5C5VWM9_9PLAN|nr:glycosyltransferase family 39 protein [Thalassoglobus neptunius]TWT43086.1 hypothetical protein KOR42_44920 [Thalassoglobus neptunius]
MTEEIQSEPSKDRRFGWISRTAILVACVVGAVGQIWLLCFSDFLLGVEGEWVWPRFEFQLSIDQWIAAGVAIVLSCFIFLWIVRYKSARTSDPSRQTSLLWKLVLLVLGFVWLNAVLAVQMPQGGLSRAVLVMFYPRTSGYFWQATYEAEDWKEFLSGYSDRISDDSDPDNYLHIGTHPPGLAMTHRMLIGLCRSSPLLVTILESTQPDSVQETLQFLQQQSGQGDDPLQRPELAALWLSILITQLFVLLAAIPVYLLSRRLVDDRAARVAAGFWLLVPTVLVFFPKSDVAFPCLALWIQLVWLIALEKESPLWGAVTAVLLITSAWMSLAFMTIGVMLFAQLIHQMVLHRRGMRASIGGTIAGLLLLFGLIMAWGVNLVGIWFQNFHNHALFYDHNSRTYFSWLGVNLLEVSTAIGAPLFVLAICGIFSLCKQFRNLTAFAILSGLAMWAGLWISGKNMGEAARLWGFLLPYGVLAAAITIERLLSEPVSDHSEAEALRPTRRAPWALFAIWSAQVAVCLAASTIVDGFGFTEL